MFGLTLPAARADVIELQEGQKIEGDVEEDAEELVVDIGVDVIRIPLSQIKHRILSKPADIPVAKGNDEALFQTADLPHKSVKDLAQQFGEGVVLIQTPGGLGSGFILNERGFCVTNYHVIEKETRIAATIYHQNARASSPAAGLTTSRSSL